MPEFCTMITLRDEVKSFLIKTKIPLSTISRDTGITYGALYSFKNGGEDMGSLYMQKLYEYFMDKPLIIKSDEQES